MNTKELKKGQTVYWLGSRVIGSSSGPTKVFEGTVANKKIIKEYCVFTKEKTTSVFYIINSDGYEHEFMRDGLYVSRASAQRAANKLNKRR